VNNPKVVEIPINDDYAYLIEGHVSDEEAIRLVAPLESSNSGLPASSFGDLKGSHLYYRHYQWDNMSEEEREEFPQCSEFDDYYHPVDKDDSLTKPMTLVDPIWVE
jgi:hypothetical protein